jgi:predicted phosphodiesterase
MALYGILGDIHGNIEALTAALAALERRGVTRLLCLGDVVGYNADPDECAALLRERRIPTIAGNHDLIGTGRLDFRRCSNKAMYSLKRTRRTLGRDTAAWLRSLPADLVVDGKIVLVHGGVRDVQQYMTGPEHIRQNAEFLRRDFPGARLCFFGHSHEQKVWEVDGNVVHLSPSVTKIHLNRELLHFVNPGSVDAQRKRGHKRAECAILDTLEWTIEWVHVPYDAASTEAKAAVFGYRINGFTDGLYKLRRRLSRAAHLS